MTKELDLEIYDIVKIEEGNGCTYIESINEIHNDENGKLAFTDNFVIDLKKVEVSCVLDGNPYQLEMVWRLDGNRNYTMIYPIQRLEQIDNSNPSEALICLEKVNTYLNEVYDYKEIIAEVRKDINTIKQALLELKAIKEAEPSDALEDLDKMVNQVFQVDDDFEFYCNKVKQALLKVQEQEKENAYIEKIETMMKQKDCVLRYIESEDCFAVKTILSDGWYKLTPEFVENNVREEIKPLPLIEKNKQLKAENAEYKRVLEIMFGKEVSIFQLECCKNVNEYNDLQFKKDKKLTDEEFDLLKRWSDDIF